MSSEDDVRAASKQFYDALNKMANGDSSSMADIWSHGASVTAMHPIGGRQVGWDAVAGSFAQVAKLASGGKVALTDQLIQVVGDMAYEMGLEDGEVTMGGHPVVDRPPRHQRLPAGGRRVADGPPPHGHLAGDARRARQAAGGRRVGGEGCPSRQVPGVPAASSRRACADAGRSKLRVCRGGAPLRKEGPSATGKEPITNAHRSNNQADPLRLSLLIRMDRSSNHLYNYFRLASTTGHG